MVFTKDRKIFIKTGFTDMRKQINGLAAIAESSMPEPPLSGAYFVFCGKSRNLIKVLYWDQTGFCLWMKRLEEATFPWPASDEEFGVKVGFNFPVLVGLILPVPVIYSNE